ncbi:hypothetical protein EBS67_11645 [bacterium]|jgi:hypothetical protein|nr:hypothetical protein [bacterium]
MEAYSATVKEVLSIYIEKATVALTKAERLYCITGFFDYLSTAEVKPLIQTPGFALFRTILLRKIHEYTNDSAVQARPHRYHRLLAVMRELFTYLVADDSVPRRRSERLKQRAVGAFNAYCGPMNLAELPPAVRITVKVLPRRSARLLARKE